MRLSRSFGVTLAILAALFVAPPAHAVSNRIFMSTNGNNASDCANPLTPCLTFAGALAQVNLGGEIIAEATGGYGALNITQAVTISGPPGIVMYTGTGVTVNAPSAIVVLRGLTIDGTGAQGVGILVQDVGTLSVESCTITNFVFGNSLMSGRGIYFGSGAGLRVKDSTIRQNNQIGIEIHPASGTTRATIDHCNFEMNAVGLRAYTNTLVTIRDTQYFGNASTAISAQNGAEINLENCLVANNFGGIGCDADSLIRVSNTTITDNAEGIGSANILSRGNNTLEGNLTDGTFNGTFSAK